MHRMDRHVPILCDGLPLFWEIGLSTLRQLELIGPKGQALSLSKKSGYLANRLVENLAICGL